MKTSGMFELSGKRVWVAGHRGMVGSALVRRLSSEGCELITVERRDLDLRDQTATRTWLNNYRPDAIFVASARVGGIGANSSHPVEFLYDNLLISSNVIEGSYRAGTSKLLYLGSSCIYPRAASQPIDEWSLLTGPLEPTNEWYAVAKIAGLKLCEAYRREFGCDFISAMPTNLYGPEDNFDPETSHVIPALMRKTHEAKLAGDRDLVVWGTGTPRREFLHVDDCADALVHLMKYYSDNEHVNVGTGQDITISELATLVAKVVGFNGRLIYDTSKPDGTLRKLMSNRKLRALGWAPVTELENGLTQLYQWYLRHSEGDMS